ncbi:RHS repeat-associated core domain-containing protein [Denitromonas halophila]|uniref:RHS repeat-associated core domain-containing protein n=1 Tax=Denitromonas halophila TaxID=1629404 RepID=A0A557QH78_9RHOO|nr:RHS repeat-associated core domain-containing protein [Denitromonas halophila]TVO52254.1 RHS repeat-associated core domain-containing protein [Denitromonas halophila]
MSRQGTSEHRIIVGIARDLAGRITGLDQNGTAYDQGFGYDAADRLTSYTGYPALRAYTYDANANRTSETLGAMITSITHVAGTNRIHKVGTQAMAFDAAGNLTSYAGKTFTHGADGRLRSSTTSAGTVTYQYDGLGRRISKSGPTTLVPGGFVRYVYDTARHLIGEYKTDGTPIKEYVWIGDLPVAVIETHPDSTTTAYAIETDHLGTPRLLTDATRAPRWRWTSPPFGEVLPEDDPSGLGAVTFNLRFPGQYYDKETGLHYNWNRYYDPGTGRYVQSDPIGLQGGWNTYGYVGGNPVSRIDPFGLAEEGFLGGESGSPPVGLPNPSVEAQRQLARHLTRMLSEIRDKFCPPDGQCPPCRTVSGRIVPVGTIAYRPLDVIPDDVMQHGVYGSHHNLFQANQYPYPKCDCFWQKLKDVAKPWEIKQDWIPIEHFAN